MVQCGSDGNAGRLARTDPFYLTVNVMKDGEPPEQPARPLKPILPPLGSALPHESEPMPFSAKPVFPSINAQEQIRRMESQRLSVSRDSRRFTPTKFGILVDAVLLATCLVVLVDLFQLSIISTNSKRKWLLGTLLIVIAGSIGLRYVERQLSRRMNRGIGNQLLSRLFPAENYWDPDRQRQRFLDNRMRRITFRDIALPEETAASLNQLVEFLKEPQKYQKLGAQAPRDLLFVGPSGSGKTFSARAVAGEANVPIFLLSEPPASLSEFHEFLDCGPKNAPCILLIDNIDSIARSRSLWPDPQNLSLESTTTALMSFLDRRHSQDGIFLFATTNRPDLIDEALIRPGRLNVVEMSYPNLREVETILKINTRKIPLAEDVDLSIIASRFLELRPNCTGALIAETCDLAARIAADKSARLVYLESFLNAMEQICKPEPGNHTLSSDIE